MGFPPRLLLSRLLLVVALMSLAPLLLGARSKIPKDKALGRQTQRAVDAAAALAARAPDQWASLEQRYTAGEVDLAELDELRVYWAAHDNRRFAASTWTLRLMSDDLDTPTAVGLPPALLTGDMAGVDRVLTEYVRQVNPPAGELLLLHAAAQWGLGREDHGAIVYRQALAGDTVFTYYDSTLQQWLRGRAVQIQQGDEGEAFHPEDLTRAEALRQDLHNRGHVGRLLLAFLQGIPIPAGGYTPEGHLTPEVTADLFDTRRMDLYFCYQDAGGEAGLGSGILTVDLDVDSFGAVTFCAVQPASQIKDRGLWECVCETVSTLRYPLPEGPGKARIRHRMDLPPGK
jgi:hypothetical protein